MDGHFFTLFLLWLLVTSAEPRLGLLSAAQQSHFSFEPFKKRFLR